MRPLIAVKLRPALVGILLASPALAQDPQYSITDLGPIGYLTDEYNTAINQTLQVNDNGLVVGSTWAADSTQRAVVFEAGSSQFSQLPSTSSAAANGVNNAGVAVGWYKDSSQTIVACQWKKISGSWTLQPLPLLSGYSSSKAWAINDNGVIVGSVNDGSNDYAAYWPNASANPILIAGGFVGAAYGINNQGKISGISGKVGNYSQSNGFVWQPGNGSPALLPHLVNSLGTGTTNWGGIDINESGNVVGGSGTWFAWSNWSQSVSQITHPYVWNSDSGITDINPGSPQTAWANSINDAGYVVGEIVAAAAWNINQVWPVQPPSPNDAVLVRDAFVYRQELDANDVAVWREYKLWNQIPLAEQPLWHFYKASDNSNIGHIVGLAGKKDADGKYQWHGYLLTPAVADLALTQSIGLVGGNAKATTRSLTFSNLETDTPVQMSLTVNNRGPLTAHQVTLTAKLPKGLSVAAINGNNCSTSSDASQNTVLQCVLPSLAVHQSAQFSAEFSANAAGEYLVDTSVSSDELDSLNNADNRRQHLITVTAKSISIVPQPNPLPEPLPVNPPIDNPPAADDPTPPPAENNSPTGDASTDAPVQNDDGDNASALSPWQLLMLLPLLGRIRRRWRSA
ncbi:MAG: hypothetical protein OEW58_04205 [Gammaproteobacteria bacterium]|nr:hypothetical protein [Gammaproteobacteria bacterium]